jgi:hypothetical protein
VPFKTIAGARKPNTADWLTFLRTCVPYVMGDTGPPQPRVAFKAMTEALNAILDATADFDPDDENDESVDETRALHLQVIEALCLMERDFPLSELSIFVHEILHVPEFVFRWNSVRNFWCFTTERFVGWMKGFVKNRSLSVENMVPESIIVLVFMTYVTYKRNIAYFLYTIMLHNTYTCLHTLYLFMILCALLRILFHM